MPTVSRPRFGLDGSAWSIIVAILALAVMVVIAEYFAGGS